MAQRRHHYEAAFEHYLRQRRVPYVAVNEARKALLPEGARLELINPATGSSRGLKSFDFVLYGQGGNLLVEVKGRHVPRPARPGARSPRLESWVTQEDVEALGAWERLFGEGFQGAFVFVYWCEELPPAALFEEIVEFRGRWYAVRAVSLMDYVGAMKLRSRRWRTVDLPAAAFERLSRSLCGPWSPLQEAFVPIGSALK